MSAPAGALVADLLPDADARTVQHVAVDAPPDVVFEAIWQADVLATRPVRALMAAARVPERIAARRRGAPPPPGDRHWSLRQALDPGSPWVLVGERRGAEVVLGLLWTPPAGGTTCAPEEFASFSRPGFAKVLWSLAVVPYGSGSLLVTETRTLALDATARRRFRLLWPVLGPFAGLARAGMLRAIARHAERSAG